MTHAQADQDNMIVLMRHEAFGTAFNALYQNGMALIEEAASYIDHEGKGIAASMPIAVTNLYTAEAMRMSTRLMQAASWLLLMRAGRDKEMSEEQIAHEKAKISLKTPSQKDEVAEWMALPETFRNLVERSIQLEERVCRLDKDMTSAMHSFSNTSPVADQMRRLETAFDR